MARYGKYETSRRLSASPVGAVYTGGLADSADSTTVAIKVLEPPAGAMEGRLLEEHVRLFLERAKLQQQVAAESRYWGPIHEMGQIPGGAYYVTDCYPQSAQRLTGRVRLSPRLLYNLASGVLRGLADLQQVCGRGHGRLEPSNILIGESGGAQASTVILADPAPAAWIGGQDASADDLRKLGELLVGIVMEGSLGPRAAWPLPPEADWSGLGRPAGRWREFCKYLLDPLAEEGRNIEEVERRLSTLRPRRRLAAAFLIPLVLAAGVGAYAFYPRATTFALPLTNLISDSNPSGGFNVTLKTADGKREYVEDQGLRLLVTADRDCYLTLLVQDESGDVLLLLPNAWEGALVKKGQTINIPPEDYSAIPISAPFGKHEVKAIATLQPLRFTGVTPQRIAAETCVTLDKGSRAIMGDGDPVTAPVKQIGLNKLLGQRQWGSAELTFQTRPRKTSSAVTASGGSRPSPP